MNTPTAGRPPADTGIVVLGMHRSGTSAITRVINLLGVPLVGVSSLLPPTQDNPAGHWESGPLTVFNDSLLSDLKGTWFTPPALGPEWTGDEKLTDKIKEARDLFEEQAPKGAWVWKDPRLCVLLPFWQKVIEQPLSAVIVYRHPLEVAQSLTTRDGFTNHYALCLWERYIRSTLANAAGMSAFVIRFEKLLAESGLRQEIVEFLQNQGALVDPAGATDSPGDFLNDDLRRARVGDGENKDPNMSEAQARLFEVMETLQGVHGRFQPGELPVPTPGLDEVLREPKMAQRLQHQIVATDARLMEALRDRDSLRQEAKRLGSDLSDLARKLDATSQQHAHASRELSRTERELTDAKAELESANAALQAQGEKLDRAEERLSFYDALLARMAPEDTLRRRFLRALGARLTGGEGRGPR